MFTDPGQEITYVISWIRDLGIFGVVATIGWKSRGVLQNVIDFQKKIEKFMAYMSGFAYRMESNHFKHMEISLDQLAKSNPYVDPNYEPIESASVPEPPPELTDASGE